VYGFANQNRATLGFDRVTTDQEKF
jgi:hypothetical protein